MVERGWRWGYLGGAAVAVVAYACVGDDPGGNGAPSGDGGPAIDSSPSVSDGAGPATDSGVDTGVDTGIEAGRCDPSKPFEQIESVGQLNTNGDDYGAWLSDDEHTIYWGSARPVNSGEGGTTNVSSVFRATRTGEGTTPFSNITENPNNLIYGTGLSMTRSGLHAVTVTPGFRIELQSRDTLADDFGAPTDLNITPNSYMAAIRFDGAELVFENTRSGRSQLYVAPGSGTTFSQGTAFNQAAGSSNDGAPVLSADGLVLYFASGRPGGKGSWDIYRAARPSLSDPFAAPQHLSELSTDKSDQPNWISPDDCVVYYSVGSVGGRDIYRARRPR